jgi:hypothetical protein
MSPCRASSVLSGAVRLPARKAALTIVLVLQLVLVLPALLGCDSTAAADCPETGLPAEKGLKRDAREVLRCVHEEFPEITVFHGVRKDAYPDHPEGRAIDIMIDSAIPDYTSEEAVALGDRMVKYLQEHKEEFRIDYIIWRQRSWSANRAEDAWRLMEDRASDNANHLNHIHVTTLRAGDEPTGGVDNEEKPPPRAEPPSTPVPTESSSSSASEGDTSTPTPAAPEIVSAYFVQTGSEAALTEICPGDQVHVVAEVSTDGAPAEVTLSISGTTSSGPSSMEALTSTDFRSGTFGIYDAGTSTFTVLATGESGKETSAQTTLTIPSVSECGQVSAFTTG